MSFFIVGILVAALAGLGAFTALLARKIVVMDSEINKAFAYVGDHLGDLLVRVNRVESLTAPETEAVEPEGTEEPELTIVLFEEANEWPATGFGRDYRTPPLFADFSANDPVWFDAPPSKPFLSYKPTLTDTGRGLPNSEGY